MIERLLKGNKTAEAITLGNSQSLAIDFKTLGLTGYHWWLPGASLTTTDHLFRFLHPNFISPQLVLLVFSPIELSFSGEYPLFLPNNLPDFLNFWLQPLNREWFTDICHDRLWLNREPNIDVALSQVGMFVDQHEMEKVFSPLNLDRDLRKLNALLQLCQIKNIEENFSALKTLVRYIHENGMTVILYTPPYMDIYHDHLNRNALEILELQKSYMIRLKKDEDIIHLDFSKHPVFFKNYGYFKDLSHLNFRGAVAFSEILRERLSRELHP